MRRARACVCVSAARTERSVFQLLLRIATHAAAAHALHPCGVDRYTSCVRPSRLCTDLDHSSLSGHLWYLPLPRFTSYW